MGTPLDPAQTLHPLHPVHLHQIAYSPDTLAMVGAGFTPLNNLANPRPDWYEYAPIRRFLLDTALDESAFYGFFSPTFTLKTHLDAQAVRSFIARHASSTDVFLFSPQPDMGACFLNVFEQGATFDPQLIEVTERFLKHIAHPSFRAPLAPLVMDSRQVVFSNFFVARPAFWREWLAVNEALYALCEGPASDLKDALNAMTRYREGAPRKVFVMERMASWLLTMQPQWRTRSANPFERGWSRSRLAQHPMDSVISDALKIAFRDQRHPQYLEAFAKLRDALYAKIEGEAALKQAA